MKNTLLFSLLGFLISYQSFAQNAPLTLDYVIEELVRQSPPARQAALTYENEILAYKNYQKEFLPAISFSLDPFNFNRSIKSLQSPSDGSYSYIEDYANSGSTGINIKQSVGFTGGAFNISSRLNMLSEFNENRYSFSTTIFNINYSQQLFGGYKNYKFQRTIQLSQKERSIKTYCKEIAEIQSYAASLFMDLYLLKIRQDVASCNIQIADTLLSIGESKYRNGTLTELSLLQLKLQQTNDRFEMERLKNEHKISLQKFISYLALPQQQYSISIEDTIIPETILYENLMSQIIENNPFFLTLKIKRAEAEQSLYNVKLSNQFNANISLSYGVNQYGTKLLDSYRKPSTQQAVAVGFQIPIFNWGINNNQYQIAKNNYENTLIDIEKEETDFYDNIKSILNDYNSNRELLFIAKQSLELAQKRYNLLIQNFDLGEISIIEITDAHKDVLVSLQTYCEKIQQVWTMYFQLQSLSLYDFINSQSLIEKLVKGVS